MDTQQCQEAWQEAQVNIIDLANKQTTAFVSNQQKGSITNMVLSSDIPIINLDSDFAYADEISSVGRTKPRKIVRVQEPPDHRHARDGAIGHCPKFFSFLFF